MNDVVGDGHEAYPVDFTAQYAWAGFDAALTEYNNLGASLFTDSHFCPERQPCVAEGDSVGRLAGPTMMGRSTIHADRSTTDASYDRDQPTTMSWMDNDGPLTGDGASHEDYYELGILTPVRGPAGPRYLQSTTSWALPSSPTATFAPSGSRVWPRATPSDVLQAQR